jgi:hypothetical protein
MADDIQGVPTGVEGTPIQGVPSGVTGTPIQGVPAGVTGTPVSGVPSNVTGTPMQSPTLLSNLRSSLHELGQQFTQAEQGADTSFAQVPATVGKVIQNIPGVGPLLSKYTDLDATTARYAAQAARPITPTDSGDTTAGTVGASLETMAEWMVGEGELRALSQGERLVKIGQNMKLLEKMPWLANAIATHPDIAATLGTMATQGTVQGAQTLAHGGTAKEALASAGTAAAVGGALEGGLRGLGNAAEGAAPTTTPIEGADFPVRAGGAELNLRSLAGGAPDEATAAVDEALSNMGQRAVARSLNRNVAARAAIQEAAPTAVTDASRMLPAPAGSAPGFTVPPAVEPTDVAGRPTFAPTSTQSAGTETVANPNFQPLGGEAPQVTVPGQSVEEAAQQAGTQVQAVPPRVIEPQVSPDTRTPAQQRLDQARGIPPRSVTGPETVEQARPELYRAPEIITPATMERTGGGNLILTSDGQQMSIARARAQQGQYESIMGDPAVWNELGTRQQQAIQNAHANISDQLRSFDDYAASQPHFDAPNVADAVANTGSLADASQQLKANNGVFWTKANDLSDGRFNELRNQEKALQNALRSEGRTGDRATLSQQLADNQAAQENLFEQHRTQMSPQEWDYHRAGYQDGMVLGNYDALIQSHFNGITRADVADSGGQLQRVFDPSSGFNSQIEKFLNTGTNRAVLERTIGREGILNTKQIGQLFDNSDRQVATKNLLENIGSSIRRHHYGIGGVAGGGLAYGATHSLGAAAGVLGGSVAAGTVNGTISHVAQRIASDPAFARSFIYAVRNNVAPRIAGPLLAAAFMRGTPAAGPSTGGQQ